MSEYTSINTWPGRLASQRTMGLVLHLIGQDWSHKGWYGEPRELKWKAYKWMHGKIIQHWLHIGCDDVVICCELAQHGVICCYHETRWRRNDECWWVKWWRRRWWSACVGWILGSIRMDQSFETYPIGSFQASHQPYYPQNVFSFCSSLYLCYLQAVCLWLSWNHQMGRSFLQHSCQRLGRELS